MATAARPGEQCDDRRVDARRPLGGLTDERTARDRGPEGPGGTDPRVAALPAPDPQMPDAHPADLAAPGPQAADRGSPDAHPADAHPSDAHPPDAHPPDAHPADAGTPGPQAEGPHGEPDPRPGWDEVAERYGPRIRRMAFKLTGDPHDAEDLTQDVFVRVYRNLESYRPGTFDGWLYRITKNLFLDRMRRRARLRMQPLGEEEWEAPVSSEPGPADVVDNRTLGSRLERALAELGEDFRLAVVLCDVEQLSYEEIAELTGWPMGTVRSRIHRGRRQLREALDGVAVAERGDDG